jgi:hypothetical protein
MLIRTNLMEVCHMPNTSDELHQLLRFRAIPPGLGPDPASLLQFFVEFEQPAIVREKAFTAFLQLSVEVLQSHVRFAETLQKAMGQKG